MPAEAQQHPREIATAHAGTDEPSIERRKLPAMFLKCPIERRALFQFPRELLDCRPQPPALNIRSHQPQALLQRQPRLCQCGQLLVERDEILAPQRFRSRWPGGDEFQLRHADAHRAQTVHRLLGVGRLHRPAQSLPIIRLRLVSEQLQ